MSSHGHEETIHGVHVDLTPNKSMSENYEQSDMQVLFRRVPNASNWGDLINWLDTKGAADNELTPGETIAMKEDLTSLKNAGVPFTNNPDKAFQEAHKHRSQNQQSKSGKSGGQHS